MGRAFNRVQLLIIKELAINGFYGTKSCACRRIAEKYKIALSTVKYNYGVLEKAGIVNRDAELLVDFLGELVHRD